MQTLVHHLDSTHHIALSRLSLCFVKSLFLLHHNYHHEITLTLAIYLKLERVAEVDFRKVTSGALELEIEYQVKLSFLIIIDDAKEDVFCLASLREFSNIMHSKKELIDLVTMLPSKLVLSLNVTKFGSKQGSTLLSMR